MNEYFSNNGYPLPDNLVKWATNCDEYLTVGQIPRSCLKRWVTWEQMYDASVGFLTPDFYSSYTLDVLIGRANGQQEDTNDLCRKVAAFARILGGNNQELRQNLARCIIADGLRGWGHITLEQPSVLEAKVFELERG